MKQFLLILAATITSGYMVSAQGMVGGVQGQTPQFTPYKIVQQLPMAPPETEGDVYLYSEWLIGNIVLYAQDAALTQLPVKVNLQSNALEIRTADQVKALPAGRVKSFTLINLTGLAEQFINAKNYTLDSMRLTGFIRLISTEKKWSLVSLTTLKLIESNYLPALDMGNRNHTLKKDETLYFEKDGVLYEVSGSSKKFAKQFGDKSGLVLSYIKENKLSLKEIASLNKLLRLLEEKI